MIRRIEIEIEQLPEGGGFWVQSKDMLGLNLFVRKESGLPSAIATGIRCLYQYDEGKDVRVIMAVPVFSGRQEVEIDYQKAA